MSVHYCPNCQHIIARKNKCTCGYVAEIPSENQVLKNKIELEIEMLQDVINRLEMMKEGLS